MTSDQVGSSVKLIELSSDECPFNCIQTYCLNLHGTPEDYVNVKLRVAGKSLWTFNIYECVFMAVDWYLLFLMAYQPS